MTEKTLSRIALVGHCGPDSFSLHRAVATAIPSATVVSADDTDELDALLKAGPTLLLINRVLEFGFGTPSGIELIKIVRARHPATPMMLVSNYPDAQESAVAEGALPGFGKNDLRTNRLKQALEEALKPSAD